MNNPPSRAYEFTIKVSADSPHSAVEALKHVAQDMIDGNMNVTCSTDDFGFILSCKYATKTNEQYVAEMQDWLKQNGFEREGE